MRAPRLPPSAVAPRRSGGALPSPLREPSTGLRGRHSGRRPSEPDPGHAGAGKEHVPQHSDRFDVAIVGGGIAGLAVAWRAQQRGLRTVVLERGALACGATHVAAGMLAPISEARVGERGLLALSRASLDRYPAFVRELVDADAAAQRGALAALLRDL